MKPRLDLIGIVVSDMARALAFYRELGLDVPPEADAEPHVEVTLPSGLRLAWDTVEVLRSFDPGWQPPSGGNRMGLAFLCDSPAEVDAAYERLVGLGYHGHKPALGRLLGPALRRGARSGRQRRRPVRPNQLIVITQRIAASRGDAETRKRAIPASSRDLRCRS